jgi:hypothetical protein
VASLDAGEIEQIVDQREEMPLVSLNSFQRVALDFVDRSKHFHLDQLDVPADCVERRPELVTHYGEKIRFCAVGLGGSRVRPAQIFLRAALRRHVPEDHHGGDDMAVRISHWRGIRDDLEDIPIVTLEPDYFVPHDFAVTQGTGDGPLVRLDRRAVRTRAGEANAKSVC